MAKAELVKSERTLKRAQALVKSGSVTPEELDRVTAEQALRHAARPDLLKVLVSGC